MLLCRPSLALPDATEPASGMLLSKFSHHRIRVDQLDFPAIDLLAAALNLIPPRLRNLNVLLEIETFQESFGNHGTSTRLQLQGLFQNSLCIRFHGVNSSSSPGLQAIPNLVVLVVPHMAHRWLLSLLKLFCGPVAEAVLDFDVLDEVQYFLRELVWELLRFLEDSFGSRHIILPLLGHQSHIQIVYYHLQAFRKQSMGLS